MQSVAQVELLAASVSLVALGARGGTKGPRSRGAVGGDEAEAEDDDGLLEVSRIRVQTMAERALGACCKPGSSEDALAFEAQELGAVLAACEDGFGGSPSMPPHAVCASGMPRRFGRKTGVPSVLGAPSLPPARMDEQWAAAQPPPLGSTRGSKEMTSPHKWLTDGGTIAAEPCSGADELAHSLDGESTMQSAMCHKFTATMPYLPQAAHGAALPDGIPAALEVLLRCSTPSVVLAALVCLDTAVKAVI